MTPSKKPKEKSHLRPRVYGAAIERYNGGKEIETVTIHYRLQGQTLVVFGNTFRFKEEIKALGGRFNGNEKNWRVPMSEVTLAAVESLCEGVGGGGIASSELTANAASAPAPANNGEVSGLTVAELLTKIGYTIHQAFSEPVWVIGEIQNLAKRPSGHFFELAEGTAHGHQGSTTTVKAILWRGAQSFLQEKYGPRLGEVLQDGLKVRCLCRVSFYKERGQISLTVEDIDPSYTKGALALAREQLLKVLRQKGLDRKNAALPLAAFPFRVGLISAAGSRAHSDFVHQLESANFPGEIIFISSPMQGEAVPEGIRKAFATLAGLQVDVIVLTRGGGSLADLRWFDTEEVAYAIAGCSVPVIAAIGHHDDVCIAEEICYERQKTPTAAAAFLLGVFRRSQDKVTELAGKLADHLARTLSLADEKQIRLEQGLFQTALGALSRGERRLEQAEVMLTRKSLDTINQFDRWLVGMGSRIHVRSVAKLTNTAEDLFRLEQLLTRKDPSPWLSRGWTQLTRAGGLIRSIADTIAGDRLQARLRDGVLNITVESTEPRQTTESQKEGP